MRQETEEAKSSIYIAKQNFINKVLNTIKEK